MAVMEGRGSRPSGPRHGVRGQATTEFAISSIVLLLLVAGIVDLGRAYFYNVSMHGAAREGARHAAWFNPGTDANPYLDEADVLCAVNQNLSGSGYSATFPNGATAQCNNGNATAYPAGTQTSCPSSSNAYNNPPIGSTYYPGNANQPVLYVCFKSNGGAYGDTLNAPPGNNSYAQGDVLVILVMSLGVVTPLASSLFGNGIPMVAYAHILVQGLPP